MVQEEDRIIQREMSNIKFLLNQTELTTVLESYHLVDHYKQILKELAIRLIYCEMLGHRVPSGYIFVVNLTQHQNLYLKAVGILQTRTILKICEQATSGSVYFW